MTTPAPSRRRFLTTTLTSTLGAGLLPMAMKPCSGSLEFGVAELGTPLHTGAEGEIGYLVEALAPAVRQVAGRPGDRLTNAVNANVALTLAQLRKSPILGPLEKSGKVKLVGPYYSLDTGKVAIS